MQETLPAELMRPHKSPAGWVLLVGLLCLLFGVAGGWALRTLFEPPEDVLASPGFTLVESRRGTVAQSLRLNASVQWIPELTLVGQVSGMVTTVDLVDGEQRGPGTVLFTVGLRPVVVAVGDVPAFRDLSVGAEGLDVLQLQQMLADLGHDPGEVDGRFDATVRNAVREWQGALGVTADGVVRVGDIVFVPRLPASLALPPELQVGVMLSAGGPVLHVLPHRPISRWCFPKDRLDSWMLEWRSRSCASQVLGAARSTKSAWIHRPEDYWLFSTALMEVPSVARIATLFRSAGQPCFRVSSMWCPRSTGSWCR